MSIVTDHTPNEPVVEAPSARVYGLDVARALAILGMILVHFGYVMSAPGWQETDLGTVMALLDGRAAGIFMVVAGIGIAVRTRNAAATGISHALGMVRASLILRGIFLLGFGLLFLAVWPGDILRVYGVALLIAAWFITARSAWLWFAIAFFVAGFVILILRFDYGNNVDWDTLTYHNLWTLSGQYRNLLYDGFRSVFPWTAFVFFGMWLGRQDLQDSTRVKRFVIAGAVVAIATELVSWLLVRYFAVHGPQYGLDTETTAALFGTGSIPPLPVFMVAAGSTAVAVIGACLLISERCEDQIWFRALVAMGQLAFTWYIVHVVFGLGAIGLLGLSNQWLSVGLLTGLGFFVFAAALSLLYRRRFRRGPLEWLMRTVAG